MRILALAFLLASCGSAPPNFVEGLYTLEIDCYENQLGAPFAITIPVELGEHKGTWGLIGMGGEVKNGVLRLTANTPCEAGEASYITAELRATKDGFAGVGQTLRCDDPNVVLQRKRLTGVLVE